MNQQLQREVSEFLATVSGIMTRIHDDEYVDGFTLRTAATIAARLALEVGKGL